MITNTVAVTITFAQHDDGSIYAALFEAEMPPEDQLPILEVAGALDAATAVEILLRAFGLDAQLINLPESGEPR